MHRGVTIIKIKIKSRFPDPVKLIFSITFLQG